MDSPRTSTRDAAWRVGGASVRGASHHADGRPNQDALGTWTSDGDGNAGVHVAVAVADGHGGARHLRSDVGARIAVDAALAVLARMAPALDSAAPDARASAVAVDLPHAIVRTWTDAVQAHLASHPITDDEWRDLAAAEGDVAVDAVRADPLLAYGATLLAAAATPHCVAVTQLGDGDVLAVDAHGVTTRPVAADERLGGNLTTSLCRGGAEADFRGAVLAGAARPALLLLATDGYANSFRSDRDFLEVGADLRAMFARDGHARVTAALPAFLDHASTHGSGDDITLAWLEPVADADVAVAHGVDAIAASTAFPTDAPAVRVDAGTAAGRQARGPTRATSARTRSLVVLALVAVLAGAAWTWRDRLGIAVP
ncbi:MAG: protein phosphatase 2C domain-containing protein, partial [Proteobacteria bacterium]|nr:protein phosphatase 2C domain-containing protein [Pseudomonadota bacterium]